MENEPTRPSPQTREAESADAQVPPAPDDMPTPEEDAAAERAGDLDPEVEENYKAAAERGAKQQGEGRIS